MPAASPHSVFSLRTSAFNNFLYAHIGEEDNGMMLTALSALARLGVDPWDEAARLSELPRETATKRLASIIAGLPRRQWAGASARDIAARLTALLPTTPAPVAQPQASAAAMPHMSVRVILLLIICLANVVAFTIVRNHAPGPASGESNASSTAAPPRAPVP